MFIFSSFQNRSTRFSYDAELEGEIFNFLFAWNAREGAWYLDIRNENEVNILTNIKLVPSYALLEQYKHISTLPQGELVLIDIEASPVTSNVTFENLSSRYVLVFFSNTEIESGVLSGI